MRGEFEVRRGRVDIRKINVPMLVIAAEKDHITPPEAAIIPFFNAIASRDKKLLVSEKGHIGLTVSSSSHRKLGRCGLKWIFERLG